MLHEQVAMLKQIGNLVFPFFLSTGGLSGLGRRGTATVELGQFRLEVSSHLGHGFEDFPVDLLEDMELADLMGHAGEYPSQGFGIQRRTVGCNPSQGQPSTVQFRPEPTKKEGHIVMGGIVVQNLVEEPFEGAVIHNG